MHIDGVDIERQRKSKRFSLADSVHAVWLTSISIPCHRENIHLTHTLLGILPHFCQMEIGRILAIGGPYPHVITVVKGEPLSFNRQVNLILWYEIVHSGITQHYSYLTATTHLDNCCILSHWAPLSCRWLQLTRQRVSLKQQFICCCDMYLTRDCGLFSGCWSLVDAKSKIITA